MGEDDGALQVFQLLVGNDRVGQEPESGVDAIDDPAVFDQIFDGGNRGFNLITAAFREADLYRGLSNGAQLGKGESSRFDFKFVHNIG